MSDKVVLFSKKEECCGCGACKNICPKAAIEMKIDEYGFLYPHIDATKCVNCGACKKVCGHQNGINKKEPKEVYAAAAIEDNILQTAASGGIFSIIAQKVISNGGIVFGVSLELENGALIPKYIKVDKLRDITKLQGSKYVQAYTEEIYKEVKRELDSQKQVLFSGIPCQIVGLKSYLKKDYRNLILIDIICHGTPSAKMFQDYLNEETKYKKNELIDYKFRDKKRGQGYVVRFVYRKKNGRLKNIFVPGKVTSFVGLFLKKEIFRDSCYSCKYASIERTSDITIGDYWGVYEEHASELRRTNMSNVKGISCVLVNTENGKKVFESVTENIEKFVSTKQKVSLHNEQLNHPCECTEQRKIILELYKEEGYSAVEKYYNKIIKKKKYFYWIGFMIPRGVKSKIKILLKK